MVAYDDKKNYTRGHKILYKNNCPLVIQRNCKSNFLYKKTQSVFYVSKRLLYNYLSHLLYKYLFATNMHYNVDTLLELFNKRWV